MLSAFAEWLGNLISDFGDWLLDGIDYVFLMAWSQIVDALIAAVNSLSSLLPAALQAQPPQIVGGIAWALSPFQIDYGLALLGSAYLIRFLIRRLPVIG